MSAHLLAASLNRDHIPASDPRAVWMDMWGCIGAGCIRFPRHILVCACQCLVVLLSVPVGGGGGLHTHILSQHTLTRHTHHSGGWPAHMRVYRFGMLQVTKIWTTRAQGGTASRQVTISTRACRRLVTATRKLPHKAGRVSSAFSTC